MSRFKFCLSVWAFLSIVLCINAESISPVYQAYIEQWKATALAQQAEFGIPASITLAQGLLESGAGQSDLARIANNHFGIKCHSDWNGKTYRKDAETRNECYRSYKRAEDSFRDHSLFLTRKRYEVLFTYNIRDYKAWARGLKACGYATDPKYPDKLIKIIETYELDKIVNSKAKGGDKKKAESEKRKACHTGCSTAAALKQQANDPTQANQTTQAEGYKNKKTETTQAKKAEAAQAETTKAAEAKAK